MMKNVMMKAVAIAAAAMMLLTGGSVTALAAGTQYSATIGGTKTTQFDKYLVMDEGAEVPNASFSYTIAPGAAQSYDVAGGKLEVLAGIGTPTITWDRAAGAKRSASTADGVLTYEQGDATILYANKGAADYVKDLVDGEKYAKATATIDFSSVQFDEPGIYRYIVSEAGTNQAIVNDADLNRVLDVYVVDATGQDGVKKLEISNYVLHATEDTVVGMDGTLYGSDGSVLKGGNDVHGNESSDYKSQGFTNDYVTYDLVISKTVTGNQGSKDKLFKFTVDIENAVPGTVYQVSIADDANANTTDGDADAAPVKSTATIYAASDMAAANSTSSLTVGADGKVSADFYLMHGQKVAIRGLAKDTKYTVTEVPEDYKPSVTRLEGTISAANDSVVVNAASMDNTEAFTNQRQGTIPTGVALAIVPGMAPLALGGAGIVLFGRKKHED